MRIHIIDIVHPPAIDIQPRIQRTKYTVKPDATANKPNATA